MTAVAEGVLGQVAAARRERISDGGDWTDVTAAFVRDAAMTAAIFGFFASGWFGWAQESPPARWSRRLGVGSVLSIAVAIAGGILGWQHWSDGTVFGPETSRDFGIVVGIEFGLAGLGAIILALRKQKEFIPPWVALVVGVHLFPVAVILQYPMIHVVGVLVTVAALVAVPLARRRSWAISFATGLLAGVALLAGATYSLVSALTQF